MSNHLHLQPSSDLMISISGIRGKIPMGLSIDSITRIALAYATITVSKTIIIARDSRPSGEYIENIVSGVLLASGKNIIRLGIVPTPTIKAVVKSTLNSSGIMISASHNPIEWNAFKFIHKDGMFYNAVQMDAIVQTANGNEFFQPLFEPKSKSIIGEELRQLHIDSVLKRVDVARIRKKKYKVFIDAVNSTGSFIVPELLERLGCRVTKVFCEINGRFPRPPEPTQKNLQKTYKLLKASDCDMGFALDPDADRLVVLSKKYGVISEEYTLPLSIQSVLPEETSSKYVVVNLSSSYVTRDVIEPFGKELIRSKVGEANVVQTIQERKAFFGGEGNGGVIDPKINSFGRDSLSGIAHILNYLAMEKLSLDSAIKKLPPLFMEKISIPVKDISFAQIKKKFMDQFDDASVNEIDGIRLDFGDSWIHVRSSNTEPIIRIIAEARTKKDLIAIINKSKSLVES